MLGAVVRIFWMVVLVDMMNSQADKPVYHRAQSNERQKTPISPPVKEVARGEQEKILDGKFSLRRRQSVHQPIEGEGNWEKEHVPLSRSPAINRNRLMVANDWFDSLVSCRLDILMKIRRK